jgi:hypothetical protein
MGELKSFCRHAYVAARACSYCGRRLSPFAGRPNSKVQDYLVPLLKGGDIGAENIVASCRECQLLKGDYLNYALLPLFLNRNRLLADVRRYLREIRRLLGTRPSMRDLK